MATGPHADVLIIGAGAAGGVAGRRLAESGYRVVCLEQGGWPDRRDYPGDKPERELLAGSRWASNPAVRKAPSDHPVDVNDSEMGILNYNGVGGGTVLYAAQWPRMLPDDFRVHTVDGVADDWPVGYDELLPYFERAEQQFGVSGLGGNPLYPPGADPPLPPLPIGGAGMAIARAHARLGWHWWPATNAIASAPYDGRHPCVQRGTCTSGCNEGAKASTDLTHWPHVTKHGGRVITGARVRRLLTDGQSLVYGAEWLDDDGAEHVTTANAVLCAANAIGTARLLLASADTHHPDGLANSSGLVGRRLMLHPLAVVSGVFPERFTDWQTHAGGLVHSLEFAASDPERGFHRGATWELASAGGPMRAAVDANGALVTGPAHHDHVRSRLGHVARWAILCEDLPEETNRVVLGDTDAGTGVTIARVEYHVPDDCKRNLDFQIAKASESLIEAGAESIETNSMIPNGHFMGTTRMGTDPTMSVVDPDCMAHDIPNLGIIDGSVFVTAGSANPTSTITALALRAAERLIERRRDLPAPSIPRQYAGFDRAERVDAPAVPESPVRPPWAVLSDTQREALLRLAASIVPADDVMPDAGTVLASGDHLDRTLAARPDLVTRLVRVLDEASSRRVGEPEAFLDQLDRRDRRALEQCAIGAYYLDRDVLDRAGHVDTPRKVRPADFPPYVEEGLLDHVLTG